MISRSNELQVILLDFNAGASVNVTYEGNFIFMAGPPQEVRQSRPDPWLDFES